jgi:hypothetical protein
MAEVALNEVRQQDRVLIRLAEDRLQAGRGSYGLMRGLDERDLRQTGWGVIFARHADPAIKDALAPLLALRQEAAGERYKIYEGDQGYQTGEDWERFRLRHEVENVLADPEQMPYYLLLVGDPASIPFSFQYQADVERAVGRIAFDTPEGYARYAQSVVQAERGERPLTLPRRAAFFGTRNPDDKATALSSRDLILPLAEALGPTLADERWALETVRPEDATKARLGELLGGPQTPALLFTATHGAVFNWDDPFYPSHQGALVTQEWPGPRNWRQRLREAFFFSGDDVGDDARVWGTVAVFFACFGAGTPRFRDFHALKADQPWERLNLTEKALLAPLATRLLSHPKGGALAVIGHVERAWTASFKEGPGDLAGRDIDAFKELFSLLMRGYPVGAAMEDMHTRFSNCAVAVTQKLYPTTHHGRPFPDSIKSVIAQLWTASNDARSYVIVGDPAVRLPVAARGAGLPSRAGETGTAVRPTLPLIEVDEPATRQLEESPAVAPPAPRPEPAREATPDASPATRPLESQTPVPQEPEPEPESEPEPERQPEPEPGPADAARFSVPSIPPGSLQEDLDLDAVWRANIKAGYAHTNALFQRILKAFMGPYRATVWMYGILFAVGVLSFVAAVAISLTTDRAVFALIFGGFSAVTFLGFFISNPLVSLEKNLEFITWLGMIYNTYWTRTVAAHDAENSQQELQAATEDAVESLVTLIENHNKMRAKTSGMGTLTGLGRSSSGSGDGETS